LLNVTYLTTETVPGRLLRVLHVLYFQQLLRLEGAIDQGIGTK